MIGFFHHFSGYTRGMKKISKTTDRTCAQRCPFHDTSIQLNIAVLIEKAPTACVECGILLKNSQCLEHDVHSTSALAKAGDSLVEGSFHATSMSLMKGWWDVPRTSMNQKPKPGVGELHNALLLAGRNYL
jgi:hypothetical protein